MISLLIIRWSTASDQDHQQEHLQHQLFEEQKNYVQNKNGPLSADDFDDEFAIDSIFHREETHDCRNGETEDDKGGNVESDPLHLHNILHITILSELVACLPGWLWYLFS